MEIVNRIPDLLKDENLAEVQRKTGLAYSIVHAWSTGDVKRIDFKTLAIWCKYFNRPVGELLEYREN